MDKSAIYLGSLVVLALAAAWLRIQLDDKKGQPRRGFWLAAPFVLPILLLAALVLNGLRQLELTVLTIFLALVVDFALSRAWGVKNRRKQ